MKQAPTEISYAHSAQSRGGRTLIRCIENATGRHQLIRRAAGYDQEVSQGRNFWEVMAQRYGLTLEVVGGSLSDIPADGPLITIANHPFGILDGLMMGNILSRTRDDFRIIANAVFRKSEEINRAVLPISFDATKEGIAQNLATRKEALRYLAEGGAVGIFPGGTVSTSATAMGRPMDPAWRTFTAKLVAKSEAAIVPVYFSGANSRLFQLASRTHQNLRLALLINEFRRRVDEPVRIVIGKAIPRENLEPYYKEPKAMMDFLRRSTYELSPEPLPSLDYGYEFEDHWKQQ